MNVQELINHLKQFNPETKVMFSFVDHTDFQYKVDMSEDDVLLGDINSDHYFDDGGKVEDIYDDEDHYIGPEIVVFDLVI